jgi:hypothetical protein
METSYRAEKIPASAVNDFGELRQQVKILIHWVVGLCYVGEEERTFKVLEEFTDPVLNAFTAHAIRKELRKDSRYSQMRHLQKGLAKN